MEHKQQIAWINGAKYIAILAVMIDLTYGILYEDYSIAYASYFSVLLFYYIIRYDFIIFCCIMKSYRCHYRSGILAPLLH